MTMLGPTATGRLVGTLVFVALIVLYVAVPSLVIELTATDVRGDVALWLYDSDAAPGDHLSATVRTDTLERSSIAYVEVYGPGRERVRRFRGDDDDVLDFTIDVPQDAGNEIAVAIEVEYVHAGGLWFNESFSASIPVYGRTESLLRRSGKAALALVSWLALIALDVLRRRWYARRHRRPGRGWLLGLVPVTAVGWLWFAELLEHATRLHGWWFVMAAVAVWLLGLTLAERRTRLSGTRAYLVEQVMVDAAPHEPFRGADVRVPVHPVSDLELAWFGAGFSVERVGDALRISKPGSGVVMIPLPASASLGGEPFEIHASDKQVAVDVLEPAAKLLGELRVHADGEQLRVGQRIAGTLASVLLVAAAACGSKSADAPGQPEPVTHESAGSDTGSDAAVPESPPAPVSTSGREPPAPEAPLRMYNTVPASTLEALRIAGDPDIVPNDKARKAIVASGKEQVRSAFKVCVDAEGNVPSASMLKTSGFPEYDSQIKEQLKIWRFRPYERDGVPADACAAFTFLYPKATPASAAHERQAKAGGFWCMTYTTASGPSSGCGRAPAECERARTGIVRAGTGASDVSGCEWQEKAWASRIKTDGKAEDWFFAEKQHCENTALVFQGTPCKAKK